MAVAVPGSILQKLEALRDDIENQRFNNEDITIGNLKWSCRTHQKGICVVAQMIEHFIFMLRRRIGWTITNRELYYELSEKSDESINIRVEDVNRGLSRLADALNVSRLELPVSTGSKGYFYLSTGTTLSVNGVVMYSSGNENQKKFIPMGFSTQDWIDVSTTARVVFLIESHAMVSRMLGEGFENQFKDFIIVNSAGYPTHSVKSFVAMLEDATNGDDEYGLPVHSFFDHDAHGIDIQVLFRYATFGATRTKNQTKVLNLTPFMLPMRDVEALGRAYAYQDKNWRCFRWIHRRWEYSDLIDNILPEAPGHFQMWENIVNNFRNCGMVLSHSLMGNLTWWFVNDETTGGRFDAYKVPNAPLIGKDDLPYLEEFLVLEEPAAEYEDSESESEDGEDTSDASEVGSAYSEYEDGESEDENSESEDGDGESDDENGESEDGDGESDDENGESEDEDGEIEDEDGEIEDENGEREDSETSILSVETVSGESGFGVDESE